MTWEIEEEEVRQTLALPATDRAGTFFQLVADWEAAWGLKDSAGWIVAKETDALPLWPHAAFAAACARGAWADTTAEPISLNELIEDLLPLLEEDGLSVAVFPAPENAGVVMAAGALRERLEKEMELGGW
ncbi:MAG TPA: DUF2750 domain-containing protein [Thermoanaerobaculia bacterium]|jgi:hypothetical protein